MKIIRHFLLLGLICISCSTQHPDKSFAGFKVVRPEDAGMSYDTLSLIDKELQEMIDNQFIAGGVVVVAKGNTIIYQKTSGYSDSEKKKLLLKDDIFRMASMSKPIISTAVMQLIERGKLNPDDPVSKFIPEFANLKGIKDFNPEDGSYQLADVKTTLSIHHLLTHTSGLAYGSFHPIARIAYTPLGLSEAWTKDSVKLAENIPQMAKYPLMHEPGEKFTYGVSIDVLGRIVEIVSGLPLDKYLEKNIFEPLGMQDTYFYLPESKYHRLVDVWIVPGTNINPDELTTDYPVNGYKTYFSGGAGLCSTALDYLKFASALLNKGILNENRILKEETVELMMSNRIGSLFSGEGEKFGYGGSVYITDGPYGRKPGRFSWGGFWQTNFYIDPARNIVVVILTNAYPSPKGNQFFSAVETLVNKAVL